MLRDIQPLYDVIFLMTHRTMEGGTTNKQQIDVWYTDDMQSVVGSYFLLGVVGNSIINEQSKQHSVINEFYFCLGGHKLIWGKHNEWNIGKITAMAFSYGYTSTLPHCP